MGSLAEYAAPPEQPRLCACGCGKPAARRWASRECQLRARSRPSVNEPPIHLVIPDQQMKPGVPNDHLGWIGRYIVDQFAGRPLTVIHLGDHWDMPSLSSYDKGKKQMEGRRYKADVAAGNRAFALLDEPIAAETRQSGWAPRKVFLFGNHEDRITRAIDSDAQLEGILTLDDLDTRDWERHAFLEPVEIDGVHYAHYFYNPLTGRPLGGENLTLRLKNIGHSFTMGHQQQFLTAIRYVGGRMQRGLVAGAGYQHEEDYLGPQGNSHWRGVLVKHQVEHGEYDLMEVSLDYLCRRYEGHRLRDHVGREL